MTLVKDVLDQTTKYTHESMDNLAQVQDALGRATKYGISTMIAVASDVEKRGNL